MQHWPSLRFSFIGHQQGADFSPISIPLCLQVHKAFSHPKRSQLSITTFSRSFIRTQLLLAWYKWELLCICRQQSVAYAEVNTVYIYKVLLSPWAPRAASLACLDKLTSTHFCSWLWRSSKLCSGTKWRLLSACWKGLVSWMSNSVQIKLGKKSNSVERISQQVDHLKRKLNTALMNIMKKDFR